MSFQQNAFQQDAFQVGTLDAAAVVGTWKTTLAVTVASGIKKVNGLAIASIKTMLLLTRSSSGRTPLFTDDFNRADANPIGGNWTTQAGGFADFAISGSQAVGQGGGGSGAYVNSVTPPDDQYAQVAAQAESSSPAVRMQTGSNSGYALTVYLGDMRIFRLDSQAFTYLTQTTVSFSAGDTLRLEAEGSTLRAYLNDVLIDTTTDATYASGRFGVVGYPGTLDNFEGGSL